MSNYKKNIDIKNYKNFKKDNKEKTSIFSFIISLFILVNIAYFLFGIPYFYINTVTYGHYKRFAFQVGNLSNIYDLLWPIDNSFTAPLAYPIRYMLMAQYKSIYKTNGKDLYNPIGTFYLINDDFTILSESKWQNDKLYDNYKKMYITELQKILKEYPDRKVTKKNGFVELSHHQPRAMITISIPNRIVFYPELAYSYYIYADINNIKINEDNLKFLKKILTTYDIVYEQEESENTINYKYVNIKERNRDTYSRIDWNLDKLNFYYPKFVYLYSTKIIEMEKELYPKTYCSDKDVINKYNSVKNSFNDKNEVIDNILLKCK